MEIFGILVGIFVIGLIIYFLFYNFWISRITSIVCCVYLLFTSFINTETARAEMFWTYVLVSVGAWLLYRGGDNVFDEHETGWVTIFSDGSRINEKEGGFIEHGLLSGILMAILYGLVAPGFQLMYYLVSIVIIVLNVRMIIERLKY